MTSEPMNQNYFVTRDISALVPRDEGLKFLVDTMHQEPTLYLARLVEGSPAALYTSTTPLMVEDNAEVLARNILFTTRLGSRLTPRVINPAIGKIDTEKVYTTLKDVDPKGLISLLCDVHIVSAGQSSPIVSEVEGKNSETVVLDSKGTYGVKNLSLDPERRRLELESELEHDLPGTDLVRTLLLNQTYGPKIFTIGFNTGDPETARQDPIIDIVMDYACADKSFPIPYFVNKASMDPTKAPMLLAMLQADLALRVLPFTDFDQRRNAIDRVITDLASVGFDGVKYIDLRNIRTQEEFKLLHNQS